MTLRVLACLAAVLLAACASVPSPPRDPQSFDLLGRALIAYNGGAVTANVRWEHDAHQDEIWLMTPTGQTLAHILDGPTGAVLTRADQQQYRATSAEALTRQALGWTLPLGLLQHWVRGRPAPGVVASGVQRDAANRLTTLLQDGWRVSFMYFPADGDNAELVRRVDLQDGANEIRFVIDTWRDRGPS